MRRLKAERDIMALCEAYSEEYNSSADKNKEELPEDRDMQDLDSDEFNPDDLFDTVDLPEDEPFESGPKFTADDIELSKEHKEVIINKLNEVLDEIEDKTSISEPALEMIINEVANDTAYLSESEEANLSGPLETQRYRIGMIDSIKKFINELLATTIDNDGELPSTPEDVKSEGSELDEENLEVEPPSDLDDSLPTDSENEPAESSVEDDASKGDNEEDESSEDHKKDPLNEGVCLECEDDEMYDEIPEVEEDDLIQVIDDNDERITPMVDDPSVGPISDDLPNDLTASYETSPDSLGSDLSDDTPLTVGAFKDMVSKLLTESENSTKSFAELWKDLSGNQVSLSKPPKKGEQKTLDPKSKVPEGTKHSTLKDPSGNDSVAGKPADKGERKSLSPTSKTPEGTKYSKPSTPNSPSAPIAKKPKIDAKEASNLVAATLNESSDKKTLSFLQEAAIAIKKARENL